MPFNIELSDQETRCLQRYFERVDETEDLSFLHPEEYLAFQRIAGQVCSAGCAADALEHSILWYGQRDRASDAASVLAYGTETRQSGARCVFAAKAVEWEEYGDGAVAEQATVHTLVAQCLRAFEAGDPAAVLALFADDARVFSPFLGYGSARDFVSSVVGSVGARLTLHDVLTNREGRPQAVGYLLLEGCGDGDDSAAGDVFYYVLNIDASRNVVRSMIMLDTWRE